MDLHLLLTLLISGLWSPSSARFQYYHLVTQQKTWVQAQSYCRQMYDDLATVNDMAEMDQLVGLIPPGFSDSIWIGLNKGLVRSWGWSTGEDIQNYLWNTGEPNGGSMDGLCGGVLKNSGWLDMLCESKYYFVCYKEATGSFFLVKRYDTWRNAQIYCRQHYTDLATIHNNLELQRVWNLLSGPEYVWIGLFFDNWVWSDGTKTKFRNWHLGQPWSATGDGNCGMVSTTWNGDWDDAACNGLMSFMCYKAPIKRLIRLKVTSDGQKDLNDNVVMTAILAQIEQTLRRQGVGPDTTLSWRKINGKVFNSEKIKEEPQKCSSPTSVINPS